VNKALREMDWIEIKKWGYFIKPLFQEVQGHSAEELIHVYRGAYMSEEDLKYYTNTDRGVTKVI
jgi:hypothetical protein